MPPVVHVFGDAMARLWDLPVYSLDSQSLLEQHSGSHCGVIALVNLGAILGLWGTFTTEDALLWHDRILQPTYLGMGGVEWNKAHGLLLVELPKHGVTADVAPARATQALKNFHLLRRCERLSQNIHGRP